MEKEALIRLIQKYRKGTCTPSEIEQLESWWAKALEDDRYKSEVSEFEREMLKQKTFCNLKAMIRTEQHEAKANVRHMAPWYHTRAGLVAACLAVFLIASVFLIRNFGSDETKISSRFGERLEVILPDQSLVVLNGNSSLRYTDWNINDDREVWLEGEAYFSVKHTENHNRFIVHTTDSLTVEVLGTQFTVTNRTGESNVVLQEGKVKLEKASNTYIMSPNEMVSFSKENRGFIKKVVNAGQKVSWKDNVIIFQDETLQSIADRLRESHGLRIVFRNEALGKEIFNGSIPGDSVEILFEKIEKLYNVNVNRNNDGSYIVEPRP